MFNKVMLLFLVLCLPLDLLAQTSQVKTSGSGFYLQTADGDTLQLSGTTPFYNSYHTAAQDAFYWSAERDGEQLFIRRTEEFRVSADFYDYIPIEVPVEPQYLYRNLDWQMIPTPLDTEYRNIAVLAETTADSVHTVFTCDNRPEISIHISNRGLFGENIFYHFGSHLCRDSLAITPTFWKNGTDSTARTMVVPGWLWDEVEPNAPLSDFQFYTDLYRFDLTEWTQHWAKNSSWTVNPPSSAKLTITDRGSQLWTWDIVPPSNQFEVYLETVDPDTLNTFHIRVLADTLLQTSQDMYVNAGQITQNRFNDGTWTSDLLFDTEQVTDGRVVRMLLRVTDEGDYLAKTWLNGEPEPDSWQVQSTLNEALSEGVFGLGAHSAGERSLIRLGVGVSGAPAPRSPQPEEN